MFITRQRDLSHAGDIFASLYEKVGGLGFDPQPLHIKRKEMENSGSNSNDYISLSLQLPTELCLQNLIKSKLKNCILCLRIKLCKFYVTTPKLANSKV